jgi:hypothetical protein
MLPGMLQSSQTTVHTCCSTSKCGCCSWLGGH